MRRMFCRCISLTIMLFSITGCPMLEEVYLKPPTKAPSQEFQEVKQPVISNRFMADSVQDMMGRIEVRFSANNTNKDISPTLHDCLSFLVKEFGSPLYRGRVLLVITDDPSDNAYITWNQRDDLERLITLNSYNIMKPIWYHYLVHELFHAFYQSSEFLKTNPDSIIEGLAIYAEYKYQNQGMSNDQIRKKIYKDTVALLPYLHTKTIDFDRPFESYGEREKKYVYLVSGLLFFNQDPGTVKQKIRKLLWSHSSSDKKRIFGRILKMYDLAIDNEIFRPGNRETSTLPAPKKTPVIRPSTEGFQ